MLYEKMRAERQRLAQEIASLKAKLKELPEGNCLRPRRPLYQMVPERRA